jgi:hypothetical protein
MLTPRPGVAPARRVATRSVAALRDHARPARVLAWLCPHCRRWVPPNRFAAATGTCRSCARPHASRDSVGGRR